MKCVTLYYNLEKKQYFSSTDDNDLFIINFFLRDDCLCFGPEKYLKWACDPNQTSTGGNSTSLDKIEGDVELTSDFDANCPGVRIPLENFIELIQTWQKIIIDKPQEVTFCLQNGKATLQVTKS